MGQFVPNGSYKETSRSIKVVLTAECKKIDNSWQTSSLELTNLNHVHVVNANGVLKANPGNISLSGYIPDGSYKKTSRNIKVVLNASCKKVDGSWQMCSLELTNLNDAYVVNVNGVLKSLDATEIQLSEEEIANSILFEDMSFCCKSGGEIDKISETPEFGGTFTESFKFYHHRMGKFFKSLSEVNFEDLQEVHQQNGDTVWTTMLSIEGERYFYYISKAESLSLIKFEECGDEKSIQKIADKHSIPVHHTYIEFDGKKYHVYLNIPSHFGRGDKHEYIANSSTLVLGGSAVAGLIINALTRIGFSGFQKMLDFIGNKIIAPLFQAVLGIMRAGFRFVNGFVRSLYFARQGVAAALRAGLRGAGRAWTRAMRLIERGALTFRYAGTVITIVLFLVVEFILHECYQNTYVYNLTNYQVEISFPYLDYGEAYIEDKILHQREDHSAGLVDLGSWYHATAYRYQSDSSIHGAGYVLKLILRDPKTKQELKTFAAMFDIPFVGENSLHALAEDPKDYKRYYKKHEGLHKIKEYRARDSKHELIVSYDFLKDRHVNPENGEKQYLYTSMIVIRDLVKV